MVSAGTEIGYKPKLSFFEDKEVVSMHACLQICMYFQTADIIKAAICFHVISSKHKLHIAFNVLNEWK